MILCGYSLTVDLIFFAGEALWRVCHASLDSGHWEDARWGFIRNTFCCSVSFLLGSVNFAPVHVVGIILWIQIAGNGNRL